MSQSLQDLVGSAVGDRPEDNWLDGELRSDHAGEYGAVAIYDAILRLARDPDVCALAREHRDSERRHLAVMNAVVPEDRRSRLLPLWRIAAWVTGGVPALIGPNMVYATIEAVEQFVDTHYRQQLDRLAAEKREAGLIELLTRLRKDEIHHQHDAAQRVSSRGPVIRLWCSLVAYGSRLAVGLARRV